MGNTEPKNFSGAEDAERFPGVHEEDKHAIAKRNPDRLERVQPQAGALVSAGPGFCMCFVWFWTTVPRRLLDGGTCGRVWASLHFCWSWPIVEVQSREADVERLEAHLDDLEPKITAGEAAWELVIVNAGVDLSICWDDFSRYRRAAVVAEVYSVSLVPFWKWRDAGESRMAALEDFR